MSRHTKLYVAGSATVLVAAAALLYGRYLSSQVQRPIGVPARPNPPPCEPIELSGILRRPKAPWGTTLELAPAGPLIKRIDVEGSLLNNVPEGTPIRVAGVVRSHLHVPVATGDSKYRPQFFSGPEEWRIQLWITELEILNDPMVVVERKKRELALERNKDGK